MDLLLSLLAGTWEPSLPVQTVSVPWSDLEVLAQAGGVAPLLYDAIQKAGVELPEDTQRSMSQAYYQAAAANTLHFRDLGRVLATLSSLGARVLLLKGAALAETLYGNVALRPMGDLDLVVPRDRVPDCREALMALGYAPTEVEEQPGSHLVYRSQQGFIHSDPMRSYVELHWHLIEVPYYMCRVPMDWFWDRSEQFHGDRESAQVLTPEANLIYLPAHLAFHHRFQGLRWFVDLALLVYQNHETLDWENIIASAQEFELLLVLRETLDRLAELWPSLPLDEPRRRLHALEPTPMESRLFRLLTAEPRSPLLDFYTDVVCLGSLPNQVRFIRLNVFPQPDYMTSRYRVQRGWELPFWYLYRLGDGAMKLARTVPQALRLSVERLP